MQVQVWIDMTEHEQTSHMSMPTKSVLCGMTSYFDESRSRLGKTLKGSGRSCAPRRSWRGSVFLCPYVVVRLSTLVGITKTPRTSVQNCGGRADAAFGMVLIVQIEVDVS